MSYEILHSVEPPTDSRPRRRYLRPALDALALSALGVYQLRTGHVSTEKIRDIIDANQTGTKMLVSAGATYAVGLYLMGGRALADVLRPKGRAQTFAERMRNSDVFRVGYGVNSVGLVGTYATLLATAATALPPAEAAATCTALTVDAAIAGRLRSLTIGRFVGGRQSPEQTEPLVQEATLDLGLLRFVQPAQTNDLPLGQPVQSPPQVG